MNETMELLNGNTYKYKRQARFQRKQQEKLRKEYYFN